MALIVKSVGYQDDGDGDTPFLIVLQAQTKDDIPKLTADVVWRETPVTLTVNPDPT